MYGAILGDIIGSPYEFDRGEKTKDFPLFSERSEYTDDSIMTLAVADAFLQADGADSEEALKNHLVERLRHFGRLYPYAGYGCSFTTWLSSKNPRPYNSFGNGSAMRVSSVGWLFDDLPTVLRMAKISAEVTHDHPEGIKGAQATAATIYLSRTGHSKDKIKAYVESNFGYDLSRTCDEIRPHYRHVESCQKTVPEAITAFLEGTDFEDVIRTAVSLGGDCDTLTCIAGSIAEAFYGVPQALKSEVHDRLPDDLLRILLTFNTRLAH